MMAYKKSKLALYLISIINSALALANEETTSEIFNSTQSKEKTSFFSFSGQLSTFTKAGFNNVEVDTAIGQYPTESFATVFGQFNTYYDMLVFINNDYINKFEFGLGASAGGLVLDSTLRDGASFAGSGLNGGSGLNNNYFGGWLGYLLDAPYGSYPFKDNRYIMLHNAYIDLQTKYFNIKAGRYESSMDYHSGYVQGFNLDFHTSYGDSVKNNLNQVKVWWFSSYGRAFAYSEWLLDFYSVKTTLLDDGRRVNFGNHAVGTDIVYGGFKDSGTYMSGQSVLVRPFFYFYPGLYEAPGLKLVYEKQFGNGYGLKATIQGFYLHVQREFTTVGSGARRYDESIDEHTGNLNIIIQGNIYNYNVRIGYYQNFGSGNSHFGTYGNPMGFDFWTAGVYDIGASISDVINRNAKTAYLSGGGFYDLKYGRLSWDILARITKSPRSDEESIALSISHAFKNHIALGLKLEWYRDTTKAGYNPGATLPGSSALSQTRTDDRSHAFITFDYTF